MIYQIIIISRIPGIKHIQEKTSHTISYGVYEKILVIQFHRRKLYDKRFLNRLFSKNILNWFKTQKIQISDSFGYIRRAHLVSKQKFDHKNDHQKILCTKNV